MLSMIVTPWSPGSLFPNRRQWRVSVHRAFHSSSQTFTSPSHLSPLPPTLVGGPHPQPPQDCSSGQTARHGAGEGLQSVPDLHYTVQCSDNVRVQGCSAVPDTPGNHRSLSEDILQGGRPVWPDLAVPHHHGEPLPPAGAGLEHNTGLRSQYYSLPTAPSVAWS